MRWEPEQVFAEIANGNADAAEFCDTFWNWCHYLDDAIDKDKELDAKTYVFANVKLLHVVATNSFFQRNRDVLLALMLAHSVTYVQSVDWEKRPNPLDRFTSQVLKSSYQEVFFYVAFLCGGLRHQVAMAEKYRAYQFDKTTPMS
jgi:hypothetical protein